jgi:hypothetical protein
MQQLFDSLFNELPKSLISFALSFFGAWLAFGFGMRKFRKETNVLLMRKKYDRVLDAHEAIWALLVFTTDVENHQSILAFTRDKQQVDTWYFRPKNAQKWLEKLPVIFYENSSGLYLNQSVKNLLFEYRNHIFGLLLKHKADTNEQIEITNPELLTRLKAIHQELAAKLKEVLDTSRLELPKSDF